MARKKQEIALQQELETQEEWEEVLTKEGLIVIDIYQDWCGPCKGIVANFKRLKNEIGDDLLRFAVAKADTIDALEHYRGKCEPCFLFYAGGSLVAVIRGANSPLLIKTITDQLKHEHKVLDGEAERKEIRDPVLVHLYEEKGKADEEETEKEEESVPCEVTVSVIKPDAIAAGRLDEILSEIAERGIEILEHSERQLTDEEAREFYSHLAEEEYYEAVIELMISGPSHILVLSNKSGENVIQEFRDLLGPKNVEDAKENAPDSLRAKYGSDNYVNAVHGADSQDTVNKELAFFFPSFVLPTHKKAAKPPVQRTLALIRPDALRENKDAILEKIRESGFEVAIQKEVKFTREQAEDFYKEHTGQPYFEELVNNMTNGPLMALGLAREDAVTAWRDMLGPKEVDVAKETAPHSLRAQFSIEDVAINQLHGSDSEESAKKELEYFFPMEQTVAVVKPDCFQTKDEIMAKIKEAGFRIAARKETELTKDIAEQFYGDIKDKDYFDDLTDHMCSGQTLFLVLSREDAVEGWRGLIGPTDPEEAKESAPDSIRAQFGLSIKENAVHGSSNKEHAKKNINLIFGDVDFDSDGNVKEEKIQTDDQEEEAGGDEQVVDEDAEDEPEKTEEVAEAEATGEEDGEKQEGEKGGSRPASGGSAKDEKTEEGEAKGDAGKDETPEGEQKTEEAGEEQKGEEPAEGGEKAAETTEGGAETTEGGAETTEGGAETTEASAEAETTKAESPAVEEATDDKGDEKADEDKKDEDKKDDDATDADKEDSKSTKSEDKKDDETPAADEKKGDETDDKKDEKKENTAEDKTAD